MTGTVVTMAAAWLPARRTARIMPVQALGDVVALPESSIRRRFVLGLLLVGAGAAATLAGLFGSVPHSGYWVGGGILAVLLGVTAAAPLTARPLLSLARCGGTPGCSAPSATSPGRTLCATRGVPRPPRRP